MERRDDPHASCEPAKLDRRKLISGMVAGVAGAAAGPAAAIGQAAREPLYHNILDHLDDII